MIGFTYFIRNEEILNDKKPWEIFEQEEKESYPFKWEFKVKDAAVPDDFKKDGLYKIEVELNGKLFDLGIIIIHSETPVVSKPLLLIYLIFFLFLYFFYPKKMNPQ